MRLSKLANLFNPSFNRFTAFTAYLVIVSPNAFHRTMIGSNITANTAILARKAAAANATACIATLKPTTALVANPADAVTAVVAAT